MVRDTQKNDKKKAIKKGAKEPPKKKMGRRDDDNDFIDDDDDEDGEMDAHEYRKFLSTLFPSKNLSKKVKAGEKLSKKLADNADDDDEDEADWSTEEEDEEETKPRRRKSTRNKKKVVYEEIEDDDTSDSEYVPSNEEDDDEDEEEEEEGNGGNMNIIFTLGEDYYDEEEESDDGETEDEDESVSSDDEDDDEDGEDESDEDEELVRRKSKSKPLEVKKNKSKGKDKDTDKKSNEPVMSRDEKNKKDMETLTKLKTLYEAEPSSALKKCISICEADIKLYTSKERKKEKKTKDKNMRIFKKILKDKNTMDDFSFYNDLTVEKQKKIIKELREINKVTRIEKPYRMTLLESDIPVTFKAAAMKKINSLRNLEPGSGDYYKQKTWVDTFMKIPFNKYSSLDMTITDGVDKCHEFMQTALKTLDDAAYGLTDAKMQIMQLFGQLLTNPKSVGTAVGIWGPPGTGKTSLVKEGISKILKRPFAFIPLGGATDSSFLEGHSITYEGSVYGRIVQALLDAGTMDVVFFFDEVDKISETEKGREINGILTHLVDTTQNDQFHDKYFPEIDFNLSRCLFIFSYNDETLVNPILKDRMYKIQTKGYDKKEKTVIANRYLLPKIREQVKFTEAEIVIPEETLHYIIDDLCNKEDGVRNLKRCLEIIYTKLNLYRLMRHGTNLFESEMTLKVEFPFTVTKEVVDKLIKKKETENISALYSMYT
jgi:ATP-dependent Lon protease